jgi:enamine deaminase RidA (YjgF/YER057c/UK114 family)
MPRKAVTSLGLHRPIGPVSHGVLASPGQLLFVSGQVPLSPDGELVGEGDIAAQYRQAIENLRDVVAAAGGAMDDVVQLVNYVTVELQADTPGYRGIAAVREELFGPPPPASTLVKVGALMVPGALVEVQAIAVLGGEAAAG